MSQSTVVETCPGCAGHLSDTWNGSECGRCGFAYVHEKTRTAVRTGRARARYIYAGSFAVMLAWIGGGLLASNQIVTAAGSGDGTATIAFHPPDAGFFTAIGLALLSILLVGYAAGGGRA